jgi:hypothetical protein
MSTDRENAVLALANTMGMSPTITDANEAVKAMQRRTVRIIKLAADPATGDATTNGVANGTYSIQTSLFRKSKLVAARVCSQVAATASATVYATINVTADNGAGGAQTVILSNTTKPTANSGLGNFAVGSYISLTPSIVSNAATVAAGSYLQLQIAKASTGTALGPLVIELDFEEV